MVFSFIWSRSFAIPPNIIAPIRPLPVGSASSHLAAGCLYHSVKRPGFVSATDAKARTAQTTKRMSRSPFFECGMPCIKNGGGGARQARR